MYSNVVFMEGTDRQVRFWWVLADCGCTISCDTVYIGIWCVSLLCTAVCLWKEQTHRLGCGECWQTAVVLIPVTLYILVFDVSVCYVQQCCVFKEGTDREIKLWWVLADRGSTNSWLCLSPGVWLGSCCIIRSLKLWASVAIWKVEFIFRYSKGSIFVTYNLLIL